MAPGLCVRMPAEHFLDLAGHILEKLVFGVCHGRPILSQSSWRSLLLDLDQFGLRSFPSTQINLFTLGVDGMAAMHPIPFSQARCLVQVFHNLSPTTPVVCTESDFSFLGCHGGL